MLQSLDLSQGYLTRYALALGMLIALGDVPAKSGEKLLYSFRGGSDGSVPEGALITDRDGNLYGTTAIGGGGSCQNGGCGTIFKLAPDGTETVLYAFAGGSDGAFPTSGLIVDNSGNHYGTTNAGGSSDQGTVFKLAPDGTETVLYAFTGGSDGGIPQGNLIKDSEGNLYGTTEFGGSNNGSDCMNGGCGTVFELKTDGSETVLYAFQGGSDGFAPMGGLIRDGSSNLYGTTGAGGSGNGANCGGGSFGCGTVFKLAQDGTETVLYSFQGGRTDGFGPRGSLLMEKGGALFGTTGGGGSADHGTVFKLAPDGTETVLYAFQGGSDGSIPFAGVIADKADNLYGTTYYGGGAHCHGNGCGTVFKLAPDGTETVLYAFYRLHGRYPAAALLKGTNGILYGTATAGGTNNDGGVFKISK